MLYGIDISNNQGGLKLSSLPSTVDFVIVKATEGTYFIDKYCDSWVQECIKRGLPWGFYHFAGQQDPEKEAKFFIEHCRNYFGHGIPVLDWEGVYENGIQVYEQSVDWVNSFVRYIHKETGIWPWIYGNPWRFNQGGVESNCARWVASYPDYLVNPSIPTDPIGIPQTDGLIACWQFASDGRLSGYNADLDLDIFYGDGKAWNAYVGKPLTGENNPSTVTLENDEYKVDITRKG